MSASDWLAGFALAAFLSLPFGMVAGLLMMVTEKPRKYDPNAPIISPRDIRRSVMAGIVFLVIFTPMCALLASADRQDAENWQSYTREHKCVVVDQRTHTEYRSGGYPGTSHSETVTEYLWRCEGGDEHWHD